MIRPDAVVITGVGTANPLGSSYAEFADRLLRGESGVRKIDAFPVHEYPSQIAAHVAAIPTPAGWDAAEFQRLDRYEQLACWCCHEAARDAGFALPAAGSRIGLVLGLGAELLRTWEQGLHDGSECVRQPRATDGTQVHAIRERLGISGPATVAAAACASANVALIQGLRWVQRGWVDAVLAGGCELSITPMSLAAFNNLRVLSRRNDEPFATPRPFDRDRDGFVIGEGGAMFMLERADAARKRGARILAELAGCGSTSDAAHLVIPSADPQSAIRALKRALNEACVNPEDVDYINAHGTATPIGDRIETQIIKDVLGSAAARVPVSSTKSMTGHLISAAAAVEALACLVAIDRQAAPPTIHLDNPDPECDLCHVPHQAREHRIRVTASNSFGFGGSNNVIVLRKVD